MAPLRAGYCKRAHAKTAKYEEMCRRFLADQADFSEEKLKAANIIKRFKNEDRECCLKEVLSYIEHEL